MTRATAMVGLGLRQMAFFGLLHPFSNEQWSEDERTTFRHAAGEVWRTDGPLTASACPHLAEAWQIANGHDENWWPKLIIATGLDRAGRLPVLDLTLPALWGVRWLHATLMTMPDACVQYRTLVTLHDLANVALDHLETLRNGAACDLPADTPNKLDIALWDTGEALAKVGPVWVLGDMNVLGDLA
ncbi:hypothetical protein [Gluconacetobacter tumulicola]|uniref:Uncharacterized protein n=1 Tax=Gluconacetobacter tumulicola TaxID=1017177 RepID=A0A7W4PAH7_9PROT|nr:hypothetical protein [Gluconacetobacter tumulicola]MBB2180105.1 hypothetical protein [Gluconacetobacter tumulicola]